MYNNNNKFYRIRRYYASFNISDAHGQKVADLTKKTENYSKLEEQGKTEEIKISQNENISVKITEGNKIIFETKAIMILTLQLIMQPIHLILFMTALMRDTTILLKINLAMRLYTLVE